MCLRSEDVLGGGAGTTASQGGAGQGGVEALVAQTGQASPNVNQNSQSQSGGQEQVRVYIARYDYNPYDGPNPCPDMELYLQAGNYISNPLWAIHLK